MQDPFGNDDPYFPPELYFQVEVASTSWFHTTSHNQMRGIWGYTKAMLKVHFDPHIPGDSMVIVFTHSWGTLGTLGDPGDPARNVTHPQNSPGRSAALIPKGVPCTLILRLNKWVTFFFDPVDCEVRDYEATWGLSLSPPFT